MAGTQPILPLDVLHLIADELSNRYDFATLFNYMVASKQFASSGAVAGLYRICNSAPIKGGGGDTAASILEQGLLMQRWSILWRSLILSGFGKTLYPYCRYLVSLDLRDLWNMFDDEDKFMGKVSKNFFSGELQQFYFLDQALHARRRLKRLDLNKTVSAIGDHLVLHSPRLEELSEPARADIMSTSLPTWAPNLRHLTTLEFFNGKALADEKLQDLLHVYCPNLNSLSIYMSLNEDADHSIANFINGMQENVLRKFETHSQCGIGAETCLALNRHGKSLNVLRLALSEDGVKALALLQACTSLKALSLATQRSSVDLKATQNDVYLEIIEWLKNCGRLEDVNLTDMLSAPDLLLPIVLNKDVQLHDLQINASNDASMYVVKDHLDFHQALATQTSLQSLLLKADTDSITRDELDILVQSLCALKDVREMKLNRISDYFNSSHISLIANHLTRLEELYIGGLGIGDEIWHHLRPLQYLRSLTFSNITTFTYNGILDFIDSLGEGNRGIQLSIDGADPDGFVGEEEIAKLRDHIATRLDGRLEYQWARDPNAPEFDSDDSD